MGLHRFPPAAIAGFAVTAPEPNGSDDTAVLQSLLDALPAAGGVIYLRPGTYRAPTGGLTISKRVTLIGAGGNSAGSTSTLITCASSTATLLTVNAHGCTFDGFLMQNTSGTPTSDGCALRVTAGDHMTIRGVGALNFYTGFDIEDGAEWAIDNVHVKGFAKYGIRIRHIDLPDSGDQNISNSWINTGSRDADASIYYQSGGGLKLSNVKCNTHGVGKSLHSFHMALTDTSTDLLITGSSFENSREELIRLEQASGSSATFNNILVTGCQFAPYTTGAGCITINPATGSRPFSNISLTGNTYLGQTGDIAVVLDNVRNVHTSEVARNYSTICSLSNGDYWTSDPPRAIFFPAPQFGAVAGTPTLGSQQAHPAWFLDATTVETVAVAAGFIPYLTCIVDVLWASTSTGTGDVSWRLGISSSIGAGNTLDSGDLTTTATFNTPAAGQNVVVSTTFSGLNISPSGNTIRVTRVANGAGDTLAADVALIGIRMRRTT